MMRLSVLAALAVYLVNVNAFLDSNTNVQNTNQNTRAGNTGAGGSGKGGASKGGAGRGGSGKGAAGKTGRGGDGSRTGSIRTGNVGPQNGSGGKGGSADVKLDGVGNGNQNTGSNTGPTINGGINTAPSGGMPASLAWMLSRGKISASQAMALSGGGQGPSFDFRQNTGNSGTVNNGGNSYGGSANSYGGTTSGSSSGRGGGIEAGASGNASGGSGTGAAGYGGGSAGGLGSGARSGDSFTGGQSNSNRADQKGGDFSMQLPPIPVRRRSLNMNDEHSWALLKRFNQVIDARNAKIQARYAEIEEEQEYLAVRSEDPELFWTREAEAEPQYYYEQDIYAREAEAEPEYNYEQEIYAREAEPELEYNYEQEIYAREAEAEPEFEIFDEYNQELMARDYFQRYLMATSDF